MKLALKIALCVLTLVAYAVSGAPLVKRDQSVQPRECWHGLYIDTDLGCSQ